MPLKKGSSKKTDDLDKKIELAQFLAKNAEMISTRILGILEKECPEDEWIHKEAPIYILCTTLSSFISSEFEENCYSHILNYVQQTVKEHLKISKFIY